MILPVSGKKRKAAPFICLSESLWQALAVLLAIRAFLDIQTVQDSILHIINTLEATKNLYLSPYSHLQSLLFYSRFGLQVRLEMFKIVIILIINKNITSS